MDKKYVVLKKFGDLKKGASFDPSVDYDGTEEDIAEAVSKGFIQEVDPTPAHDVLVAQATELNVDFDDSTTDEELVALINEALKKPAKPVAAKGKATKATVTWNGGVREYSLEIHGENFLELANELAAQYPEAVVA